MRLYANPAYQEIIMVESKVELSTGCIGGYESVPATRPCEGKDQKLNIVAVAQSLAGDSGSDSETKSRDRH
jgi:hypothetical protein